MLVVYIYLYIYWLNLKIVSYENKLPYISPIQYNILVIKKYQFNENIKY